MRSRSAGRSPLFSILTRAVKLHREAERTGIPLRELLDMEEEHLAQQQLVRQRSISRRDFLKGSVAAGGLLVLTRRVNALPPLDRPHPTDTKVVIIGAGISGLTAAYELRKRGISAQIYEASERTGGRMFTATDLLAPGLTTELGGEFIDSNHTDLLQLAKELKLELYDMESKSESKLQRHAYYFDGKHHSDREIMEAFQPVLPKLKKDIALLPDVIDHNTPDDSPAHNFDWQSIEEYLHNAQINGLPFAVLNSAYTTEYGQEIGEQSSLNLLTLIGTDLNTKPFEPFGKSDERYKIKGGNQRIPTELAKKLSEQIMLGHKLTAITQKDKQYTLSFDIKNGAPKEVSADILLITIPFSVLRDVKMNFPVSVAKRRAIDKLTYGNNTKLFIGMKKRLWRDQGYSGYTFTDEGYLTGWDNSQLQPGTAGGFTVLLGGTIGYNAGANTPENRIRLFMPGIERTYPGFESQLNGKFERFAWPTYEFSKGSYTCYSPSQWTMIGGLESLPIGNIFFAGEHCSYEFQGFMNGGAETGKKAAMKILSAMSVEK